MKIYTCCHDFGCALYGDVIDVLLRYGVEPSYGTDDGGAYVEVKPPQGRKRRACFCREILRATQEGVE